MAVALGVSDRTIKRYISSLVEKGLIKREEAIRQDTGKSSDVTVNVTVNVKIHKPAISQNTKEWFEFRLREQRNSQQSLR